MSSCEGCKKTTSLISCKKCSPKYIACLSCSKFRHTEKSEMGDHLQTCYFICEECEDGEAVLFCKSCEQNLCQDCDTRIHNKGKRAQHIREKILTVSETQISHEIILIPGRSLKKENHVNLLKKFTSLKGNANSFLFILISCEKTKQDDEDFLSDLDDIFNNYKISIKTAMLQNEGISKEELDSIIDDINGEEAFANNSEKKNFFFLSNSGPSDDKYLIVIETLLMKKPYLSSQINFFTLHHIEDKKEIFQKDGLWINNAEISKEILLQSKLEVNKNSKGTSPRTHGKQKSTPTFHSHEAPPFFEDNFDMKFDLPHMIGRQVLELNEEFSDSKKNNLLTAKGEFDIIEDSKLLNSLLDQQRTGANFNLHHKTASNQNLSFSGANPNLPFRNNNNSYLNNNSLNQSFNLGSNQSADLSFSNLNNSYDNFNNANESSRYLNSKGLNYFPMTQNMKNIELRGSIKLSHSVQKVLFEFAENGELLIQKQKFVEGLLVSLDNWKIYTQAQAEEIIKEAEQLNLLTVTTRKFDSTCKVDYISQKPDYLSYQSLIWVLSSIRNDHITPTEKLVLSRIKECFSLKINPKSWEKILNSLRNQKFAGPESDTPPGILGSRISKNKFSIPKIQIVRMKDPLIGNETNALFFRNQEWKPEDNSQVQDTDENWKAFLGFLETYFSSPADNSFSLTSLGIPPDRFSNDIKDSKSNKGQGSINEKNGDLNQEVKTIPGGRYGCAQFIKACGGPELQKLSLGRLNLFVQEAINKGIIRYHRTLLIKNSNKEDESEVGADASNQEGGLKGDSDSSDRAQGLNTSSEKNMPLLSKETKIRLLQKALLDLLKEYPSGVSLAQIPQNLKKKVPFSFTIQDLGFPKLKNFLNSLQDKIDIPMAGTNNSYAILKANLAEEDKVLPNSGQQLKQQTPSMHNPVPDQSLNKSGINRGHPSKAQNQSTHNFHQQYPQSAFQQPSKIAMGQALNTYPQANNMNTYGGVMKTNPGQGVTQEGTNQQQMMMGVQSQSPHLSSYSKRPMIGSAYRKESDNGFLYGISEYLGENQESGQKKYQNIYEKQKYYTLKPENKHQSIFANQASGGKKENRKKVSTLEEYLQKVIDNLCSIMAENQYGLKMEVLYTLLTKKLGGVQFDYRLFNCPDFYNFIANYLENLVDIECKKNYFIVYPKDYRFGSLGMFGNTASTHDSEKIIHQQQTLDVPNINNLTPVKSNLNDGSINDGAGNYSRKNPNPQNFLTEAFNNGSDMKTGIKSLQMNLSSAPFNCSNLYGSAQKPQGFEDVNTNTNHTKTNPYFVNNYPTGGPTQFINGDKGFMPPGIVNKNLGAPSGFQAPFTVNAAAFYSNCTSPQQNVFQNLQNDSPKHNRNVSLLNFNGGHGTAAGENFPAIYSHTRNDSKNTYPIREENSYIELNEQMRFIEELLRDDDQSLRTFYEKTESQIEHAGSIYFSPNQSVTNLPQFGMISSIKDEGNSGFYKQEQMERMHSKALSDDFNFSKRQGPGDEMNKAHGRVYSTFEKKN